MYCHIQEFTYERGKILVDCLQKRAQTRLLEQISYI